jgi:rubrerythrin
MFELMHKAMGNYNEKLSKTTDETDRAAIQKTIVEEQTLYGEIKAQLIDIIGNKETLISKLEAYGKTIQ